MRVFRLVTENSVEERVVARAQRKLYLDAMVTSGAASSFQSGVTDVEKLTKSQLLGMLSFGSDVLFKSEGQLEDRDIDAILAGAKTELIDDNNLEQRAEKALQQEKMMQVKQVSGAGRQRVSMRCSPMQ